MIELTILLFVAAAGFALANALRVPTIPVLLLFGLILGAVRPPTDTESQQGILQLGLAFLVFVAGLELNPQRFGHQIKAALWVGFAQFFLMGLTCFGLALVCGFNLSTSLYVAFAVAASSTLVVIRLLKIRAQSYEPFGRLVTGVLLVQDVLMIFIIIALARYAEGSMAMSLGLVSGAGLMALALVCQRWIMPWLIIRLRLDEETILLVILATLFAFTGVAAYLEIPIFAGAFMAGFALSRFPVNGIVRGPLNSISDFFLAIFFTALGALVSIPDPVFLLKGMAFVALVVVLTPPLVTLLAERQGLSSRSAIEAGLLIAQTSEFSLVLGVIGLRVGHISLEVFSMIALVTVVTMMLTPFLATDRVTRGLLHLHPGWRRVAPKLDLADHILILGFGAGGMWVVKPLKSSGHSVTVVDDDPVVIDELINHKIDCLRGDGSDVKVLEQAGAKRARLIIASMRRISEAEKVLHYVRRSVPVIVRVFEQEHAEHIKQLGGIPILNSHAAADTFMEWFDKKMVDQA